MEVLLDRFDGLPYEFRQLALDAKMQGESLVSRIEVTICRRNPWGSIKNRTTDPSVQTTETKVDFQFRATYEGNPAVRFIVSYVMDGATGNSSSSSLLSRGRRIRSAWPSDSLGSP